MDKRDVVVQVGTPWPRTMKRLRRAVGPQGKAVIIEAEASNFKRLCAARDEAGFDNVHIVNYAAWSRDESGELSISPSFHGDHKIDVDGVTIDNDLRSENAEMIKVPCEFRKVDTVLAELGIQEINYLSVTVNGAELEVLNGALETLKRSPSIRVFLKAHSLDNEDIPISKPIRARLEEIGFSTMLTKGEPSSSNDVEWDWRAGDVYAWKSPTTVPSA